MPEVKLTRVVSVSSEDKKFPAANLLGAPGSGKWKSAQAGEKQLSVIVQFAQPSQITSIHIGNEGSAFVEILVAKETASSDHDWKVLLVASSLMTPADARSNINLQKVRLFNTESLVSTSRSEKWDRAKLVCTQPFNKSQQFGLSFISFINEDDPEVEQKSKPTEKVPQKLGAFTLRDDTDSDEPSSKAAGGSMFSDRARLKADIPPATAAAAVRAASRDADSKVGVHKEAKPSTPIAKPPANKPSLKRTASPVESETLKYKLAKSEPNTAGSKSTPAKDKPVRTTNSDTSAVPFKEIFKGVVFSLSGFKNPKRSDLREKSIEMGAKYSLDWDKKCSHLICAFTTTPKFSQVNGKGYIVTEDWVLDSYKRKRKLPWRDYRLGRAKSPARAKDDDEKEKQDAERKSTKAETKVAEKPVKVEDNYAGSTDVDSDEEKDDNNKMAVDENLEATQVDSDATEVDSMDTDDEIAAHLAKADPKNKGKAPANGKPAVTKRSNDSAASTSTSSTKRELPVLPDFILDKVFFFYGNVKDRHSVYRYIYAYGGSVEDYMCDEVNYVITDESWDDNFDSALSDNDRLIFVKSKWIKDIHSQQKSIPHQKYAIVP